MEDLLRKWGDQEPKLRRDWHRKFGYTGLEWGSIRDAYQFGWIAAQLPEFEGYSWNQVEKDLSEHWYNPQLATEESAWDYVKEAVETGWTRAREGLKRAA
ncbi:MAG: hypothetical protein HYY30_15170 [Chloroflexi bacterium]|nr:hypothetical protein [Chloroflexota bacterium]